MKIFLAIIFSLLILIGCEENSTEPEVNPDNEKTVDYTSQLRDFFPTDIGDKLLYNVDTLNNQTNSFDNIGTRLVSVENKDLDNEEEFYICNETHTFFNSTISSESKFSISESSVNFFADSSGVSELIPDSVEVEIVLLFDKVFHLVDYPYSDKHTYKVFNAGANFGTFKFNIYNIIGKYSGTETVTLDGFESNVETEKFEYELSVNIPDISNPFASKIQLYYAYVWFNKEMGIVKIEGSKMFVNPITGGKFDIVDSNKVVRHSLVSYNEI